MSTIVTEPNELTESRYEATLPCAARVLSKSTCAGLCAPVATGLFALSAVVVLAQQAPSQQRTPEAPPAAAPAPPSTATQSTKSPSAAVASWQRALVARLDRFKRYPSAGAGAAGVVSLGFTIDRQGKVLSSRVVKSSGSAVLDSEALDMIKRAAPLPPPPAEVVDADLSFVIPLRFSAGESR